MNNQKLERWQEEIKELTKDVQDIYYSQYLIKEIEAIIKQNTFVQNKVGSFWEYYKLNFTYFVISKIFHQIDENPKSASLVNLLKDLLCNCEIVTKDWWVGNATDSLSLKTFERNFGKERHLDPLFVCDDIKRLKEDTAEVKKFRHKRVAHKDKNGTFSYKIDSEKVHKATKTIEELIEKYYLLLTQSEILLTPIGTGWTEAFTVPWVEGDT